MNEDNHVYQWSRQDKPLHLVPAIPLILFYVGTVVLRALRSVHLVAIFLLLWLATNLAVVGICAGCPYRGRYCPGVSQLYIAPFLAAILCSGTPAHVRTLSGTREVSRP